MRRKPVFDESKIGNEKQLAGGFESPAGGQDTAVVGNE
tara:strand:+ start:563 stop:676 length:114 start_codon:yes stop_codon:yes gene_type:complete